ncbi:cytochrome c oxidase subunit 3 [Mesorhizobium sp.]|uniref:cytochrome c oxidase subunit 3 n=1 Tax=Mesorhizobium sp. TaxID=1871066 RepID=UPI000FE68E13|nr:cytochrome c oxidase subunit 3 [Mesorhizobium sp.]RWB26217.1 MAG: cytochrome c oxidase subunit 3 family protein [Mesorhizobium sp.]
MAARTLSEPGVAADADTFLLWVLAWSELAAFGILLSAFLVTGFIQQLEFAAGQAQLHPFLAGLNTLVLLTSGWQAALAGLADASRPEQRRSLVMAALFGFLFVFIKLVEYGDELRKVEGTAYGHFFELYFIITGFHLLHVVFGAGLLLLVAWRPSRANIGLVTTLWHVIDLIWVSMFPIVYLS